MKTSAFGVTRFRRHLAVNTAACVLLTSGVLLTSATRAADTEPSDAELRATPYRPTVSNPAALPVPRHFEWEAGGLASYGHDSDRHVSVPFLLKYAFNPDIGVLVGGESFVSDRAAGDTQNGWGDTTVELKYHHAVSDSTALGVEAGAKLPTASADLGSGHTDFTANGIVSTQASGFDVDINASYPRLGITDARTNRGVLGWAIAASHDLAKQWGVAAEFSGAEQSGAPNHSQFLAAVSFTPEPTVVLDAGALAGLDRAAPRYGVFAGLTVLIR